MAVAGSGYNADPASAATGETARRGVTEADRAAWLQWAQERAAEAWRRGQAAEAAGDLDEALRWFERAHRLAESDWNIVFGLAALQLRRGDAAGAATLFARLVAAHDLREGWVGLAAARQLAGDPAGAAAAIAAALSRHAVDEATAELAGAITAAAGLPGWCGLSGEGELLGTVGAGTDIRLDGEPLGRLAARRRNLPRGWQGRRILRLTRAGTDLLGSPIAIPAQVRSEGFVTADAEALHGWAWLPGSPETDPLLRIVAVEPLLRVGDVADPLLRVGALADPALGSAPQPASGEAGEAAAATIRSFVARDRSVPVSGAVPLARPRGFRLPLSGLPAGALRVIGPDGRDLLGSPLDPGRERRSAAALAGAAAKRAAPAPEALADAPIWADLIGPAPAAGPPAPAADVVIPVYRGLAATLDCLRSVLATVGEESRIFVVDDASPEPELAAALDGFAAAGRIRLIRHDRNRGFPAAANAGIRAAGDRDVVLLNSDTRVAPGWLAALRAAAHAAADIGTATPISNDATILSYPRANAANPMPDAAQTRRLAALARAANAGRTVDIPTAHGFCMYIRRDCLAAVGLLREDVFAQGYGEENDFSLRARHLGWRHVAVPGVFVAHLGGGSFGAARQQLIARNLARLNRLHPGYDALIGDHIAADPLAEARRRLDIARWRRGRRGGAVLLITHEGGGGVDRALAARCALHSDAGLRPIVLRPSGGRCVVSEGAAEDTPNLRFAIPDEMPALLALLKGDRVQHAELHHLLGHQHALLSLPARLGVPYDVYIHDYAWFCPRIALVGGERRYCGEPDIRGCETCIATHGGYLDEPIAVGALVGRSARDLRAARRVVAPSTDCATRLRRHFPRLRPEVEPWEDDAALPPLAPAPPGARARVCVVGAIGIEKGYDVLLACVRDAAARRLPLDFIVVGHTIDDETLMEAGPAFVTGTYRDEEVVALIRAQQAQLAFLPSIWPETWCYTLGHAWRAGLPAVAFDIGAPAERIRRTGRGWLLPLGLQPPAVNAALFNAARLASGGPSSHDRIAHVPTAPLPA